MNYPYIFGEDRTRNNINTGPTPKTLTKLDADTDTGGNLNETSFW